MADQFIECHDCKKVFLVASKADRCPSCDGTHFDRVSAERVQRAIKAGTYFNPGVDGKRAKKKRKS